MSRILLFLLSLLFTPVAEAGNACIFAGEYVQCLPPKGVKTGAVTLPDTTTTLGQIAQGGKTIFHTFSYDPGNFFSVFIGPDAGNFTSTGGADNYAIGYKAMEDIDSTCCNVAIGSLALNAMTNSAGSNIAIGDISMYQLTLGTQNTALGAGTLINIIDGENNTAIGYGAGGTSVSSDNNTMLGANANTFNDSLDHATAIGADSVVSRSGSIVLGRVNDPIDHVGIGSDAPGSPLTIADASPDNSPTVSVTTGAGAESLGLTATDASALTAQTTSANAVANFIQNGTGDVLKVANPDGTGRYVMLQNPDGNEVGLNLAATGVSDYNVNLPNAAGVTGGVMALTTGPGQLSFTQVGAITAAPATSGDSCTAGAIAYDASFFYVCIATDTWKRAALVTF